MATKPTPSEQEILADMMSFRDDPLGFVLYAYTWGKPNTPLAHLNGPRRWQRRLLARMGEHIRANRNREVSGLVPELMRIARASGRGIGKSTVLAWCAHWMASCVLGSTVAVSANSEQQIKSSTFPEIKKWISMSVNAHWFDMAATTITPAKWLADTVRDQLKIDAAYWYIQQRLWSEESPDAYAGLHNAYGMMLLFEEASGIPAPIWTVAEGFFREPTVHRFWIAISNPRRNTGAFYECFHRNRDAWDTENIDGRDVEDGDNSIYDSIIRQYGEDSDEARVEVKGQFPSQGDKQFIARGVIDAAARRHMEGDNGAPLIIGVDVARYGDDTSVIFFRRGRDARSMQPRRYRKTSTTDLVGYVATAINDHNPDAVVVDGGGVGGGVVDQLRGLGYRVVEANGGESAHDKKTYRNRRVEMWGRMREWLGHGCIDPADGNLADDLAGPEYKVDTSGRVLLESKEDMKKRGLASPDAADALALTFAVDVPRRDLALSKRARRTKVARDVDYDIFA